MSYKQQSPLPVEEGGIEIETLIQNGVLVGNTVGPIHVTAAGTNGQVLLGSTGAFPAFGTLTSTGGTIIFTPGASSLNLETSGSTAASFPTDSGTATPALGVLTIAGGVNIGTTGAVSTVTVNLDAALTGIDSVTFTSSGAIRTGTTNGDAVFFQAYDIDDGVYRTYATLFAGTTTSGMDLADNTTKAGGYIYRAGGIDVTVADGGTGLSNTSIGGIFVGTSTTTFANLPIGANATVLTSNGTTATWAAPAAGGVTSVAGTANQITSTGTTAVTLSIPSTFIAPGSIAATTSITATLGNITATSGNLVLTSGLIAFTAATSSTVSQITYKGNRDLHWYGGDGSAGNYGYNLFLGKNSGNFTLGTAANVGGNIGIGQEALKSLVGGNENVAIGYLALGALTGASNGGTGYRNVAIGPYSLYQSTTGINNIGIGYAGGGNYTTSDKNNISLNSGGTAGESNVLRVGNGTGTGDFQLSKAFIHGIYSATIGATSKVTLIDSAGQLGGLSGAPLTVLVGGTAPSFTASPTVSGTVTGSTGIIATTGNIAASSGSVTASATVTAGTTMTAGTGITATTGNITATTGNVVITSGLLAMTSPTTSTKSQITIAGVRFLHGFNNAGGAPGSDANLFLGATAGNFTLTGQNNNGIGSNSLNSLTSGFRNNCIGALSGDSITDGADNTLLGDQAGTAITTGIANCLIGSQGGQATVLASGNNNTAVCGYRPLSQLTTGSNNLALGTTSTNSGTSRYVGAGWNYTGAESNNIIIQALGTTGESNVLRIGDSGTGVAQVSTAFIAGISGVTVASSAAVLMNTGTGQLGTIISSRRYKDKIETIEEESDILHKFNPVSFVYKTHPQEKQWGLIAEEVAELCPDLATYDEQGLPDSVKYHLLPALMLREIQKLRARIEKLEAAHVK